MGEYLFLANLAGICIFLVPDDLKHTKINTCQL